MKHRKSKRCGVCYPCRLKLNCGMCKPCNRKGWKQKCVQRQCVYFTNPKEVEKWYFTLEISDSILKALDNLVLNKEKCISGIGYDTVKLSRHHDKVLVNIEDFTNIVVSESKNHCHVNIGCSISEDSKEFSDDPEVESAPNVTVHNIKQEDLTEEIKSEDNDSNDSGSTLDYENDMVGQVSDVDDEAVNLSTVNIKQEVDFEKQSLNEENAEKECSLSTDIKADKNVAVRKRTVRPKRIKSGTSKRSNSSYKRPRSYPMRNQKNEFDNPEVKSSPNEIVNNIKHEDLTEEMTSVDDSSFENDLVGQVSDLDDETVDLSTVNITQEIDFEMHSLNEENTEKECSLSLGMKPDKNVAVRKSTVGPKRMKSGTSKSSNSSYKRPRSYPMRNQKNEFEFKCIDIKCQKQFSFAESLTNHIELNHADTDIYDMLIENVSAQKTAVDIKIARSQSLMMKCPLCTGSYKVEYCGVERHLQRVHRDVDNFNDILVKVKKEREDHVRYYNEKEPCSVCGESIKNSLLPIHLQQQHYDSKLAKEMVDEFRTSQAAAAAQHKPEEDIDDSMERRQCDFCGQLFSPSYIYQHSKICKDNPDRVVYTFCQCGYRSLANKPEDMKKHKLKCPHKIKPVEYVCELCGRICKSLSTKFHHRKFAHGIMGRNSTEIKNYNCNFCDKVFQLPCRLRRHLKAHSDERNYMCHECGATFKEQARLTVHTRTMHQNIYRYTCDKCGHGMMKPKDLKRHVCGRIRRNKRKSIIEPKQTIDNDKQDEGSNYNKQDVENHDQVTRNNIDTPKPVAIYQVKDVDMNLSSMEPSQGKGFNFSTLSEETISEKRDCVATEYLPYEKFNMQEASAAASCFYPFPTIMPGLPLASTEVLNFSLPLQSNLHKVASENDI